MLMDGFAPGVAECIGAYVYLLIDPRTNETFYVGKGIGGRCFSHLVAARQSVADTSGDYPKLARIRDIEAFGAKVRIDILRHGLSEQEAFLVEAVAIDLMSGLTNQVAGHGHQAGRMSVAQLDALYGARSVPIDSQHRLLLININRNFDPEITPEALYEATRKWWKVGSRRTRPGAQHAPEWAFAVYRGVVRAVYAIEGWEQPTAHAIATGEAPAHRVAFR